jgi:hypothetical protein
MVPKMPICILERSDNSQQLLPSQFLGSGHHNLLKLLEQIFDTEHRTSRILGPTILYYRISHYNNKIIYKSITKIFMEGFPIGSPPIAEKRTFLIERMALTIAAQDVLDIRR